MICFFTAQCLKEEFRIVGKNFIAFIRWLFFGIIIGIIVGMVGVLFHFGIEFATEYRLEHAWILWLLPIGGILIAFTYRFAGMEKDRGTNFVLVAIRSSEEKISLRTAPLIFFSTIITHLFGGSSGREGAALQLGGSIASKIGRMLNLDKKDRIIFAMSGMSAAFSALFGTPITSVIFSMEVITVGIMHYSAIVPCVTSAMVGASIASYFGVAPTAFQLYGIPEISVLFMIKVLLLSMLCALLSILFCTFMKRTSAFYRSWIPDKVLRAFIGGCIVITLTFLVGTTDYNGAGMDVISRAIAGEAKAEAFLLKIVFTAFTLGAGFKGGEIVPAFFVGSTFGNIAGKLLGLSPSFGAGIGLVAIFCGVTNCPLTSLILSIELFGIQGLGYFAVAVAVSYILSGYYGLYSEQKIVYSKIKPIFIDRKAE